MRARRSNGDSSIDKVKRKRKDGTIVEFWRGRVSVGIDPRTGQARRITLYGTTRGDLSTKIARIQSDASRGIVPSSERITVAAYMKRWLNDAVRSSVRPATLRQYECISRLHIVPHIGRIQLDKLTPADVQHLLAVLERDGVSARIRELVYAVLHRALGQALQWDLVFRNVVKNAAKPRVARREMQVLTPEQSRLLLSAAKDTQWHALFVLALSTGMRQGELLALHWADIDLEAAALGVRHTLTNLDGKPVLAEPKTAKSRRRIELSLIVVDALREHRRRLFARGLRGSPWVFPNAVGGPQDAQNLVRRVFHPLLKANGLPAIRFHDLRHTAATLMLQQGVHPKVVQECLGHSTIAITLDTYSHIIPSMQRDAASAMNALLGA